MIGRFFLILLVVLAVVLAGIAYWKHREAEAARDQLGLDAGRVLNAIFSQAQDLRVATLRGNAIARSEHEGTIFKTEQITRAPFQVGYFLDLGAMNQKSYLWDSERRVMIVQIPDIKVEPSNVDLTRAQVRQEGIWISRDAGQKLQQQAARQLTSVAANEARSEQNMAAAREAARRAVQRLVQNPLAAAGYGGVDVVVLFSSENPNRLREQWDVTKSVDEVLANRQ